MFGPLEVNHGLRALLTGQIGAGREHRRSDHSAGLDLPREVDLLIRVPRTRRANGRHAGREVEPRARERDLCGPTATAGVVTVIVQPDQPGDHRVARQVEDLGVRRDIHAPRRPDLDDPFTPDEDRLARDGRGTRPVDHLGVRERDEGPVDRNELLEVLRGSRGCEGRGYEDGGGHGLHLSFLQRRRRTSCRIRGAPRFDSGPSSDRG